jgi:tRNA(fMet)-specific endonuclease VapC
MTRLLVDTSAYAAFFRDHPGVKAAVQEASGLFLSPIVMGELRSGFLKGGRADKNEAQLQEFLASPRCNVPVLDEETAHRYAAIHHYLRLQGTPVSPNDLWIAASAAQHGLTVLTLDGDFDRIPQVFVKKFEPPPLG